MYVVTVEFEIDPEHVASFRDAMLQQAANSLDREIGCHQFDVCFSPDRSELCFLYEKYTDRAAFDEHLASEHFRNFDATVGPWVTAKTVSTWHDEAVNASNDP